MYAKIFIIIYSLFSFSNCEISHNEKRVIANIDDKLDSLKIDSDTTVFTVIEEMPILLECKDEINGKQCSDERLIQYLFKNIRYNPISRENGVDGKIVTTFIIEKDGGISNIKILRGEGLSNVKEVIQNMPKWKPGSQNNTIKRVKYLLPINVHLN